MSLFAKTSVLCKKAKTFRGSIPEFEYKVIQLVGDSGPQFIICENVYNLVCFIWLQSLHVITVLEQSLASALLGGLKKSLFLLPSSNHTGYREMRPLRKSKKIFVL